jgi:inner membrane protease subunit 2
MESDSGFRERNACLIPVSFARSEIGHDAKMIHRSPTNPEKLAVKRVIALEGDTVYTRAPCPIPTVQVPVNHVWVEGDNRDRSQDSNSYGPLPKSLIQGKLTYVLWPWKSSGPINWAQFKGKTRVLRGRRQDAPNWD